MLCSSGYVTFSIQGSLLKKGNLFFLVLVLNISTSAQLTVSMPCGFQPAETPDSSSSVTYFPYFDGHYLAVAASLNGGNVLAMFVNMLGQWIAELGKVL